MNIDLSNIDMSEKPVFALKNLDGTTIQTLTNTSEESISIRYNETSELSFNISAFVNGVFTPNYDKVVGMRIIDVVGYGQFILANPETHLTGVYEYKTCTAYSLEYELTFKKLSLSEATYNFWNPVAPDGTILSIILEKIPAWSLGDIDDDLVGKYRTFEVSDDNIYNFIKSTLQDSYSCVFDFDTYNRKINVRSTKSHVQTEPVFISMQNLANEIQLTEDTENIYTCIDVNGAEGVEIRSVNPLGTNKIYNFDYFITLDNFSQDFVSKYNTWKDNFASNQLSYYNITIDEALQITRKATETAALTELKNELSALEVVQSTYIEAIAQNLDSTGSQAEALSATKIQIENKNQEIAAKEALIESIQTDIDELEAELKAINERCAFETYFSEDEIKTLNKYIKEDSITESTFVVPTVTNYNTADESSTISNESFTISGATISYVVSTMNKKLYNAYGGTITCSSNSKLVNANLVNACIDISEDNTMVFTAYMNKGSSGSMDFESACLSFSGTCNTITSDCVEDSALGEGYKQGTTLTVTVGTGNLYMTQNATEYQQRSVEWELFEYGQDTLNKLAYPSYTFNVSPANFFSLDEFKYFKSEITLGRRCYLQLDEETVLTPIFIGVELSFDSLNDISLMFSDTYSMSDSAFNMVDLLNQSISMGKTVDFSKYTYSSFVDSGASTNVKDFMESALDVSKNAVMSSDKQEIKWDGSGLRLRKQKEDGTYEDEQIWIINNNICFTDDNWETAKMAIGKFVDENLGSCWGVVAPNIVGTLIAGSNLVIESEKEDGGISVFKVDADGASLHNATFDIYNGTNTQITLNPYSGIAIGSYPLYTDDKYTIDTDNAKFWVDVDGNLHLKGTLEGVDGKFSGELSAATGTFKGQLNAATGSFSGDVRAKNLYLEGGLFDSNGNSMLDDGKITSDYLDLLGLTIHKTDGDGNYVNASGGIVDNVGEALKTFEITNTGDIIMSGSITWNASSSPVKVLYSRTSTATPTLPYSSYPASSATGWHTLLNTSYDYYASYSYDGGTTWTSVVQLQGYNGSDGQDGVDGQDGKDGSDANVPSYIRSTYIDMTQVSTPALYGNYIYANGAFRIASLSQSSSGSVSVNNVYGEMGLGTGNDGTNTTTGVVMKADSEHYFICTNTGVRMQSGDNSIFCTDSYIQAKNSSKTVNLMNLNSDGGTAIAVFG